MAGFVKVDLSSDWSSEQILRAKWLQIVTARHLRKARKTIRELRGRVERLQDRCYEKDALKAIDCLEKAAGLGRLVSEEREDG